MACLVSPEIKGQPLPTSTIDNNFVRAVMVHGPSNIGVPRRCPVGAEEGYTLVSCGHPESSYCARYIMQIRSSAATVGQLSMCAMQLKYMYTLKDIQPTETLHIINK